MYLESNRKPSLQAWFWILDLKDRLRGGWNYSNLEKGIERTIDRPESVMAHIGSAAILAMAHLPEREQVLKLCNNDEEKEKYYSYDKNRIIRLILMHDIGEYEIGDIAIIVAVRYTKRLKKNY